MRILLLGASGLAGQAFKKQLSKFNHTVVTCSRNGSDFQMDLSNVNNFLNIVNNQNFDTIINCAALTNLVSCNKNPQLAWKLNAKLPYFLAAWSLKTERPVLHISTDHLFCDGKKTYHSESAPVYLRNIYAETKYSAECFLKLAPNCLILRTSIIGSRGWEALTFAEWAFKSIKEGQPLHLYKDAFTSSIEVGDFAKYACKLFLDEKRRGLLNLAAGEVYSKAEFIIEMAAQLKLPLEKPNLCSIREFNQLSGQNLGLDVRVAQKILDQRLPSLEKTVDKVLTQLS